MSANQIFTDQYSSTLELQKLIVERISKAKADDPFYPVTLLVDSPLHGMLLRRQLASILAADEVAALGNVKVQTRSEFVFELYRSTGRSLPKQPSSSVIEATIYALMETDTAGAESLQSMATAYAIATIYKKLEFVSSTSIQQMHDSDLSNSTQRKVLELVLRTREAHNVISMGELTEIIASSIDEVSPKYFAELGQVHCLLQGIPTALAKLIGEFGKQTSDIHIYELAPLQAKRLNLNEGMQLVSASDPWTEASIAVRAVAQKLKNFSADRIAILYPDATQYAGQIQTELELAGISWHGKSRNVSQSSVLSRTLDVLLEAFADRTAKFSGLDRPRLMRLLENGSLTVDSIDIKVEKVRKFVRRNDLYADATTWIPILSTLDTRSAEDEDDESTSHLAKLVNLVDAELGLMSSCSTWKDLGLLLQEAVSRLHQISKITSASELEEDAWKDIRKVLSVEVAALDELSEDNESLKLAIDPKNLLRLVRKRVGERKLSNGNLSTGIFVGEITEAQLQTFDVVYVLGATEGVLPATVNPDPFLPSRLLEVIGETSMAFWNKENLPETLGRTLGSIVNSAVDTLFLRPRGGTQVKLENEPSRYLPGELNEKDYSDSDRIIYSNSFLDSFIVQVDGEILGPISNRDLNIVSAAVGKEVDTAFRDSMNAWANPVFDEYFGNLETLASSSKIWETNDLKPLSSTKIDSYINCQYRFFASSVLGFSDSDRRDSIDGFSAASFGVFFHEAMDSFVKSLASMNQLPKEGEPFIAGSAETFFSEFLRPNLDRFIRTGRNGWERSLSMHLDTLIQTLPDFFANEAKVLRGNPALAVIDSEVSFGKRNIYKDPTNNARDIEWELTVADEDGDPHRIVGQVDRLDASADGRAVGVMDFKTGARHNQVKKLGIIETGQSSSVHTLQDVIYRLAALAKYPDAESVEVNFVFVARKGDDMFLNAKYATDPKGLLPKVLKQIKDSGSSGQYLPLGTQKPINHEYCKACSYLADITDIVNKANKKSAKESK